MSTWRLSIDDLPDIFADVEPIVIQDDNGVAAIDYSDEFRVAYGYWRAVQSTQEVSERVLLLTGTCLCLNPANYTLWHRRRHLWKALFLPKKTNTGRQDLDAELTFAQHLGGSNPKNYQIWYHRRALLQDYTDNKEDSIWQAELHYVSTVLQEDAKNYHAWSHRHWLAGQFDNNWQAEVHYTQTLIESDVRNNSAWNHRWWVVHNGLPQQPLSKTESKEELDYSLSQIRLDPYNESSVRYFMALVKEQQSQGGATDPAWNELLDAVLSQLRALPQTDSKFLLAAQVDLLEWKGDAQSIRSAIQVADQLSHVHDEIRHKFWKRRIESLKAATGHGS